MMLMFATNRGSSRRLQHFLLTRTYSNRPCFSATDAPRSPTKRFFSSTEEKDTKPKKDAMVHVTIEEAKLKTKEALEKIGWDESDADMQAEIMVHAELCGNNQGLVKMYQPKMMAPDPRAGVPEVVRETRNSAVMDGHQAPGMIVALTACDMAMDKLANREQQNAISIVVAYNSSTSSGQLGYYADRMARHGCIGIGMCNSPEFVAAAPGGKPVFGTNPLAVGVPVAGQEYPFVFDMATSAIALFGVLSAKAKGEPLPPNVAYGKDGGFTTDASEVLEGGGSIATFGGHKGMGLSLCVELLAGALSGAAVLGQVESKRAAKSWGHTFIAINPNLLVDDFDQRSASILDTVRASAANENSPIRIPGERSSQIANERLKAGVIPVPEAIWKSILRTAEHGLSE